jgi:hypothetical protein
MAKREHQRARPADKSWPAEKFPALVRVGSRAATESALVPKKSFTIKALCQ